MSLKMIRWVEISATTMPRMVEITIQSLNLTIKLAV